METNDNRVSKYFTLTPLRITELKQRLQEADKIYQRKTYPIVQNKYLFGIEVEAENVKEPHALQYWNSTTDNSLRNNGREFVSYPLRMDQLEGALAELRLNLNHDISFSSRTSVHIHMNVRDLTISQIISLTLLYLSVEKVLFKWVGHNREQNPFCVPLHEAGYNKNILPLLEDPRAIRGWNKYSALNLAPISQKGTVEFRHMYGTLDVKTLMTWINLLACLKETAKNTTLKQVQEEINRLNSNSAYYVYVQNIFKQYAVEFDTYNLQELMEYPVSLIKMSQIKKKPPTMGITNNRPTVAQPRRIGTFLNFADEQLWRDIVLPAVQTTTTTDTEF